MIKSKGLNIKLVIVGKGKQNEVKRLNRLIKDHGLESHIEMIGWQPFEKVYSYMVASDVGLVPHNIGEHTNNTIPHKLFQFMMVGIPVLVSNCKPLERVVRSIDAGLVFEAGDPLDFADKVLTLNKEKLQYEQYKKNAKQQTLYGKWSWDYTGQELVEIYTRM